METTEDVLREEALLALGSEPLKIGGTITQVVRRNQVWEKRILGIMIFSCAQFTEEIVASAIQAPSHSNFGVQSSSRFTKILFENRLNTDSTSHVKSQKGYRAKTRAGDFGSKT